MIISTDSLDMSLVRFKGESSAEATVLEFGDFTCPICRQAEPAVRSLLEQFPGRIRFGYWQFPIKEMRPEAELAAEATEAAAAQGSFWEYSALIWQGSVSFEPTALVAYAQQLGLDVAAFRQDLLTHRYLSRIRESVSSARALGIKSTPTFLVNGRLIDASFGLRDLRDALRQVLSVPSVVATGRHLPA